MHSQSHPSLTAKSKDAALGSKEHAQIDLSTDRRNDLSFEDESERQRRENGMLVKLGLCWLLDIYLLFNSSVCLCSIHYLQQMLIKVLLFFPGKHQI